MNKQILIFSPELYPILLNKPAGGSENRLYLLFNNIKRVNFLIKGKSNITINNYIIVKNFYNVYYIFKQIKRSDLVIFGGVSRLTIIYCLIAKFLNKKNIFFITNNQMVGYKLKFVPDWYYFFVKLIFKFIDVFIAQTRFQEKIIKQKYPNKKIYYLPNPVVINKNIKYQNKNYILWVGRNHPVKGLDVLEKTIKSLPNINFKIIGLDNNPFLVHYPNVDLLGRINPKLMRGYYNDASILINTSYSEGFPNVFLEAFANKTPIISYDINPDNFLLKSKGGMCAKKNMTTFLKIINELYYNNRKTQEMGCNGYYYIKKNNDLNIIKTKIHKIIDNI